ncbi:MAG TPA: FtsH protease activity modulator HflK, partial [Gallionellaceae bacterium]|nr:FtsH protease activity modulator HflK [Gallionellaceae bacterium]
MANDPQWGNRKKGPPDLEEMLRNLNKKLAALLGGKGGGAGGGGAGGPGGVGIGLIIGLVLLVWAGSGFYKVDSNERGVVLRFGKYIETTQPGPHWHLPYPMESVDVINTAQVRTVEVGYRDSIKNQMLQESQMLTDDENIVDVQIAVQYSIKNVTDYLFNNRMPIGMNGTPDDSELVRQIAETSIREVVGKSTINNVLYEGQGQVVQDTTKLMQDLLDRYKTGIQISQVSLQNAQPPQEVQAAFDDAVKAKADEERQKNEGMAYANNVVPRATGEAARLRQQAEGYKQAVIASAQGDASRFRQILVEYNKAPRVTRERMYIDTM